MIQLASYTGEKLKDTTFIKIDDEKYDVFIVAGEKKVFSSFVVRSDGGWKLMPK
jgi:hypothetical protein